MPRQQSSAHKDSKHAYIESGEEKKIGVALFFVKFHFCFQIPISDSAPSKNEEKIRTPIFFAQVFGYL